MGRRIGSAALVADGVHARTDGFTSLAVVLGALGLWLGFPLADPIVGLLISTAIVVLLIGTSRDIGRRLLDGVDPALVMKAERDSPGCPASTRSTTCGCDGSVIGWSWRLRSAATPPCPSASSTSSSTGLPSDSAAGYPVCRLSGSRPRPTRPPPIDQPTETTMLDDHDPTSPTAHAAEPHYGGLPQRLNWLRAGVLGANDGIVSTAAPRRRRRRGHCASATILTAGVAGLVGGAVSMALGEYVSVSSQRDTERALLDKERTELATSPAEELDELAALYVAKGASPETARRLAEELTAKDAFAAHVDVELGIDPEALTNPWHAALSSAVAFTVGSIPPLLAMVLSGPQLRIPLTFVTVLIALAITGAVSARLGSAKVGPAVVRLMVGGGFAMAVTYAIGRLLGSAGL